MKYCIVCLNIIVASIIGRPITAGAKQECGAGARAREEVEGITGRVVPEDAGSERRQRRTDLSPC